MGFQPRRHSADCNRGYNEHAATRSEYGHAKGLARNVDSKSTFSRSPQPSIELDTSIDVATAQRLPWSPKNRNQTECCRGHSLLRTNRKRNAAWRGYSCSQSNGPQIGSLNLQQRHSGTGIAAYDLSWKTLAAS